LSLNPTATPTAPAARLNGVKGGVMNDATTVLVVCLLLALLARIFWRMIVNLLLIVGISVIFAAIFFVIRQVQQIGTMI
jgi:uncharacterized membrane protein